MDGAVLLVVWSEVSSTGACRQLGGARTWCWDGDLQESPHWLIFAGTRNSLAVQHPGLSTPTPGAQAQLLTREPRPHKPRGMALLFFVRFLVLFCFFLFVSLVFLGFFSFLGSFVCLVVYLYFCFSLIFVCLFLINR